MFIFVCLWLPIFIVVAGMIWFIGTMLKEPSTTDWTIVSLTSGALLLPLFVWMAFYPIGYNMVGVVGTITLGIYGGLVVGSLYLLSVLPRERKHIAPVVGLVIPLLLWLVSSYHLAQELDAPREQAMICKVVELAGLVEGYYEQNNHYPEDLGQLGIDETLFASCDSGEGYILYSPIGEQYALGMWYKPVGLSLGGTRVCLYSPANITATCGYNTWGPFPPDRVIPGKRALEEALQNEGG